MMTMMMSMTILIHDGDDVYDGNNSYYFCDDYY